MTAVTRTTWVAREAVVRLSGPRRPQSSSSQLAVEGAAPYASVPVEPAEMDSQTKPAPARHVVMSLEVWMGRMAVAARVAVRAGSQFSLIRRGGERARTRVATVAAGWLQMSPTARTPAAVGEVTQGEVPGPHT